MAAEQTSFKVLMFPFLAHGHIFPFLELAKKLSNKNFQIFFCSTPVNLDSIRKSLTNDDFSIQFVELHLPSLPELPPHYHTTKNIPPHLMPILMKALQMSSSSFSDIIEKLEPDLLIYDLLQPWSAKVAASQGIPAVYFHTGGAASSAFVHHWHTHGSFDNFPYEEISLKEYEKRDLTAVSQSIKVQGGSDGFAFGAFELSSEFVLVKSCRGIEGKYMDYLSSLCGRKTVPTGPLIAYNDNGESESEILRWLGRKGEKSTLYISFGSENYFTEGQIREIAKGLELWRSSSRHCGIKSNSEFPAKNRRNVQTPFPAAQICGRRRRDSGGEGCDFRRFAISGRRRTAQFRRFVISGGGEQRAKAARFQTRGSGGGDAFLAAQVGGRRTARFRRRRAARFRRDFRLPPSPQKAPIKDSRISVLITIKFRNQLQKYFSLISVSLFLVLMRIETVNWRFGEFGEDYQYLRIDSVVRFQSSSEEFPTNPKP